MISPEWYAFPRPETSQAHGAPGMTFREFFAALAMQGLLAAPIDSRDEWDPESVAKDSVKFADALIEELNK